MRVQGCCRSEGACAPAKWASADVSPPKRAAGRLFVASDPGIISRGAAAGTEVSRGGSKLTLTLTYSMSPASLSPPLNQVHYSTLPHRGLGWAAVNVPVIGSGTLP